MALQPGTTNLPSFQLEGNLTVGGTAGFVGAETHSGAETHAGTVTFSGPSTFSGAPTFAGTPTFQGGQLQPGTRYAALGTVTFASGFVDFNASVAGFAVRLPAPVAGADFTITNHIAPASGLNTITIPAGGTIYAPTGLGIGTVGTVLSLGTAGQAVRLVGLSSTQYQMASNLGTVTLS